MANSRAGTDPTPRPGGHESERAHLRPRRTRRRRRPADGRPASQVMRPGPTTIRPSEDLGAARERMRRRHVPRLLVSTPDGELLGLLSAD
jgi:CBS domain-containing protein